MITDRTQSDVEAAIAIRNANIEAAAIASYDKISDYLTPEQINQLERGTITINTLNRIEDKQAELKRLLNAAGYYNTQIINTTWRDTDIFKAADFRRIVNNETVLRNAFYTYADTPDTPAAKYHYETINDLEKILEDLDVMIADMKTRYRRCGTFRCGEAI